MQSRNRFFEDAAKLAGSAAGTVAGVRREFEALARQQMERMLSSLDLVTRDEFDAVKEIAVTARREQEKLAKQVAALEKQLAAKAPARAAKKASGKAKKAARKKAAKRKSAPKA